VNVRAVATRQFAGRAGNAIVERLSDGQRFVLPRSTAGILQSCTFFAPVEAHAEQASKRLQYDGAAALAAVRQLTDLGLLEDEVRWRSRVSEKTAQIGRVTTLAIVTRQTDGRWPTLERCLRSFTSIARRWEHRGLRFLIADDASSAQVRETVRDRLRAFSADYPEFVFEYLGHEEKERLAGANPVLRFLLFGEAEGVPADCGTTVGANRNAVLLATRGEIVWMADDDTYCRPTPFPGGNAGGNRWKVSAEPWPAASQLFESRAQMDLPAELDLDVFAAVGSAFGPLRLDERNFDPADSGLRPETLRQLEDPTARVVRVQVGLAGDNGGMTPNNNLMRPPEARIQLMQSEAAYQRLILTRTELRIPMQWTLAATAACMSYSVAIDNRSPAAVPFPPTGRDEDGVFGRLQSLLEPAAFTAFAPWAVVHDPPEVRQHEKTALGRPIEPLLNESIILPLQAIGGDPLLSIGPSRRQFVAAHLGRFAGMPAAEFRDQLVFLRCGGILDALEGFRRGLAQFDSKPAFWARDMQRGIELYTQHLQRPELWLAHERGASQPGSIEQQQSYLRAFSQALGEWT
jgi:hypothetical protein